MLTSFWTWNLQTTSLSEPRQLAREIQSRTGEKLMLGSDAQQVHAAYLLTVSDEWRVGPVLSIGILSEGHGLVPRIFLEPVFGSIWLGFNRDVVAIDLGQRRVKFEHRLESLFRCFIARAGESNVLVFHEIGVLALDRNGDPAWIYSKDVIESCTFAGDFARLEFMDTPTTELDLRTGRPITR